MKLIVCDMSGIVSIKGVNNSELLDVFPNLKNFQYTFCTGKGYMGGYDTIKDYDIPLPLIVENGSVLVSKDGKVIHAESIDNDSVCELIDEIFEMKYEFIAFVNLITHKYKFLRGKKDLSEELSRPYFFSEETFYDKEQYKKSIKDHDIVRIITRGLEVKDSIKSANKFHVVVSEQEYHSFCKPGKNKKSGIIKLVEKYGFNLEDVIIIGNDSNDIDMFGLDCGLKIATGNNNTPKELLELADVFVKLDELPNFLVEIDKNPNNMLKYRGSKGEF
ncbi:MAG: HAD-IIB family hydrolase [Ignavibacteriales bacterium]